MQIYIRLYDQPLVRQNKEADKLGKFILLQFFLIALCSTLF